MLCHISIAVRHAHIVLLAAFYCIYSVSRWAVFIAVDTVTVLLLVKQCKMASRVGQVMNNLHVILVFSSL